MPVDYGAAMEGFYRGYGFMNDLQQQKLENERKKREEERAEQSLRARIAASRSSQSLSGLRFEHQKSRDKTRDEQWLKEYDLRADNAKFDRKMRRGGLDIRRSELGLRQGESQRSKRDSDLNYQLKMEEETRRQNAESAALLQNIFSDDEGKELTADKITQAHLDQAVPILNRVSGLRAFGAANPDVDPDNPFAGARLVRDPEGGEPRVVFNLQRKDGGKGQMTVDRETGTDANVVAPTLSMARRVLMAELNPKYMSGLRERRQKREDERSKTNEKIRLEQAKAKNSNESNKYKNYAEMIALGVPAHFARGRAYGTIREVSDDRGTVLIDEAMNGMEVGALQRKKGGRGTEFVINPEYVRRVKQQGLDVGNEPPSGVVPTGQTNTASSAPVRVTTKAQVDQLPSGTRFVGPDGKTRVKP